MNVLKSAAVAVAVFVTVIAAACSSSDPYEPPQPDSRPMGGGMRGGRMAAQGDGGGLEMLPPGTWWHDSAIATAVNLTSEQVQALDKIESAQGDDITRMTRDTQVAVRQLRDALDADPAKSEDILAAGQRLRSMRDNILDRQLRLLAAERGVLSRQQWTALEDALQSRRSERMQERGNGGRGRGGRGGFGGGMGGGRRPGWPG